MVSGVKGVNIEAVKLRMFAAAFAAALFFVDLRGFTIIVFVIS